MSEQTSEALPETHGTAADERSVLARIALALVAISVVGLLLLFIGESAGWDGFTEGDDNSSIAGNSSWISFSLGAILALITGVIAWVRGGRSHRAADVRAGQIAVGYFVLAVIVLTIFG